VTKHQSIKLLVTRLEQPQLGWNEIEELLTQFPGWLTLVQALHYPVRPMDNRIVWGPVQSEYTQISSEDRVRLLEFFRPFSILMDPDLTPLGRLEALHGAGINAAEFCKEHRNDGIPELSESAESVLEALTADHTLLRGYRGEADHLVLPSDDLQTEQTLLPPGGGNSANASPARTSWIKRFLGK
jgi:hypothetical protein